MGDFLEAFNPNLSIRKSHPGGVWGTGIDKIKELPPGAAASGAHPRRIEIVRFPIFP
jgi:hypothetical protein